MHLNGCNLKRVFSLHTIDCSAKCKGNISTSLSLVDKNIVRPSTVAAGMPQIIKNSVSGAHAKTDFEKDMTSTVSQVWFPYVPRRCSSHVIHPGHKKWLLSVWPHVNLWGGGELVKKSSFRQSLSAKSERLVQETVVTASHKTYNPSRILPTIYK
jgi:hypothetical protein